MSIEVPASSFIDLLLILVTVRWFVASQCGMFLELVGQWVLLSRALWRFSKLAYRFV
jgi:hypothetical protein